MRRILLAALAALTVAAGAVAASALTDATMVEQHVVPFTIGTGPGQVTGAFTVTDEDPVPDPPPPAASDCADGLDNDADGAIDTADFGCVDAADTLEAPNPACSDGRDNDGDGLVDLEDPGCRDGSDTGEFNPPPPTETQPPPPPTETEPPPPPTETEPPLPPDGTVELVDQTFNCSNYAQPVNLELVRVTMTDTTVRRDGFHTGGECSGTIGRVEIVVVGGDGMKIGQGGHDLMIDGGFVRCDGNIGDVHQDGIQVMGGERVTLNGLLVDCTTATNSAMYINQGAGGNGRPTDVVCDGCTLQRGPDRNRVLRIGDSLRSGARNSTIVWCGTGPECSAPTAPAVWFNGLETDPVNENNTLRLSSEG